MARYPAWAAFVVTAAVVVGCGPGKELPTDVPKVDPSIGQQQVVPNNSDPEAKAVIDKAVKAVTGGKPELLAKGKFSRVTLKGTMSLPVRSMNEDVETVRTIVAVYPDRFFGMNENQILENKFSTKAWLRRPELVVSTNDQISPASNATELEQIIASDVLSQHWMALMLPATDPKAVVFDLQRITLENRALQLVKLSLPNYPMLFHLAFDSKTDALLRVEYDGKEGGLDVRKLCILSDHKTGPDGLFLPTRREIRHAGIGAEKWTVEKWEFPPTIDDKEFSPPQPK